MSKLLAFLLILSTSLCAMAQSSTRTKPSASRAEIRDKAKNLAVAVEAAEAALSPAELAIAERVHVGHLPCELGNTVTLSVDPKTPGYFNLQMGKIRYRMFPVETSTGAIRLEDQKNGAVWLQLANKSMLMNQKLGKRLADECMSPIQVAAAEALKKNPAPSVLDAPAAPATSPTGQKATN